MKRIVPAAFILCFSCTAWAHNLTNCSPHFYLGLGAGEMFYQKSGTNFIGTGSGWPADHYNSNNISDQPYGFLAAGFTWQRAENWLPSYSLGLRYMYVAATTVSGNIDQYSLPAFKNYNFNYDVQLLNVLATLKANIYRWQQWLPYILLGAGVSNYYTSDYSEQALSNVTPRVSPGFQNSNGNNFAYELGIGIDYAVLDNLSVNLEYDYMSFGTVRTGKGLNYSTLTGTNFDNESLKNSITATTLFLGLTYYLR